MREKCILVQTLVRHPCPTMTRPLIIPPEMSSGPIAVLLDNFSIAAITSVALISNSVVSSRTRRSSSIFSLPEESYPCYGLDTAVRCSVILSAGILAPAESLKTRLCFGDFSVFLCMGSEFFASRFLGQLMMYPYWLLSFSVGVSAQEPYSVQGFCMRGNFLVLKS